jgi:hypothetical protein
MFYVFSWRPQGKKELYYLFVRKSLKPSFQELVPKPLSMAFAFVPPVFFVVVHVRLRWGVTKDVTRRIYPSSLHHILPWPV